MDCVWLEECDIYSQVEQGMNRLNEMSKFLWYMWSLRISDAIVQYFHIPDMMNSKNTVQKHISEICFFTRWSLGIEFLKMNWIW